MIGRFPLLAMTLGLIGIVFSPAKLHAAVVADPAYGFTGSSQFAWSLAYACVLIVSSYAAGLPGVPRRPGQIVAASIVAPATAAIGVSLAQLALGDALLPRFVVFGTAAVAAPWLVHSVVLRDGR